MRKAPHQADQTSSHAPLHTHSQPSCCRSGYHQIRPRAIARMAISGRVLRGSEIRELMSAANADGWEAWLRSAHPDEILFLGRCCCRRDFSDSLIGGRCVGVLRAPMAGGVCKLQHRLLSQVCILSAPPFSLALFNCRKTADSQSFPDDSRLQRLPLSVEFPLDFEESLRRPVARPTVSNRQAYS